MYSNEYVIGDEEVREKIRSMKIGDRTSTIILWKYGWREKYGGRKEIESSRKQENDE